MEEYLRSLIEPLLSEPQALRITPRNDQLGLLLIIDIDHKDMGMVIGKEGRTISAIRSLVHVKGMKTRQRVSVRVNEPVGGKGFQKNYENTTS